MSPFIDLCAKFDLSRDKFIQFLVADQNLTKGTAQNLAAKVWGEGYMPPRNTHRLAEFLAKFIPYGIAVSEFEEHLNNKAKTEQTTSLERSIAKLEGIYEVSRYHSELEDVVQEYITLYGGRAGYANYKLGSSNSTYVAEMSVSNEHLFFRCDAAEGKAGLFVIVEFHDFGKNSFAGMIMGLDDSGDDMVCCDVFIRKISHETACVTDFGGKKPGVPTRKNYRAIRALGIRAREKRPESNVYRFSGKIMRTLLRGKNP